MAFQIRSEVSDDVAADIAAIEAVTIAAFAGAAHSNGRESEIVRDLRRREELAVSLVAEAEGVVIGHAAASPVSVTDGSPNWFGLGPVSVLPARQRRGVGSELVRSVLRELRQVGAHGCVVLGEPEFYHRFGFECRADIVLPGVPTEYFQALSFCGAWARGQVSYSAAFA